MSILKLNLNTVNEKSITLETEHSFTIAQLKDLIQEKEGIPRDEQLLTFQEHQLKDDLTLKSCNIEPNSTLHLSRLYGKSSRRCIIGICAMSSKVATRPMKSILDRLRAMRDFKIIIFPDGVILNDPIESWPIVDCLISFFSYGFPLQKALDYKKLRKPYCVNDIEKQFDLLDRAKVYEILEKADIPIPPHRAIIMRNGKEDLNVIEENSDHVIFNGYRIDKPFVEKPVDAENHNVCIYFSPSQGAGARWLFRKLGNHNSRYYPHKNKIRRDGSYIYEKFITSSKDIKFYAVGEKYVYTEARKSPTIDGIVERDPAGKEIRFPTRLRDNEKLFPKKIVKAFKQPVCGFDVVRSGNQSYVIDVNGWSFVKNQSIYYDNCSRLLREFALSHFHQQLDDSLLPQAKDLCSVSGTLLDPLTKCVLRSVVSVIRHSDRWPKEKFKVYTNDLEILHFFQEHRSKSPYFSHITQYFSTKDTHTDEKSTDLNQNGEKKKINVSEKSKNIEIDKKTKNKEKFTLQEICFSTTRQLSALSRAVEKALKRHKIEKEKLTKTKIKKNKEKTNRQSPIEFSRSDSMTRFTRWVSNMGSSKSEKSKSLERENSKGHKKKGHHSLTELEINNLLINNKTKDQMKRVHSSSKLSKMDLNDERQFQSNELTHEQKRSSPSWKRHSNPTPPQTRIGQGDINTHTTPHKCTALPGEWCVCNTPEQNDGQWPKLSSKLLKVVEILDPNAPRILDNNVMSISHNNQKNTIEESIALGDTFKTDNNNLKKQEMNEKIDYNVDINDPSEKNITQLQQVRELLQVSHLLQDFKVQLRPVKYDIDIGVINKALIVIKWGGNITHTGILQSKNFGKQFRDNYLPSSPEKDFQRFCGPIRAVSSAKTRVINCGHSFLQGFLSLHKEDEKIPDNIFEINSELLDRVSMSLRLTKEKSKEKIMEVLRKFQLPPCVSARNWVKHNVNVRLVLLQDPMARLREVVTLLHTFRVSLLTTLDEKEQEEIMSQQNLFFSPKKHHSSKADGHRTCSGPRVKEALASIYQRYTRLEKGFYDQETDKFDVSKISELYDCIKFDALHHLDFLPDLRPLYNVIKRIADFVIPHEHGISKAEKWHMAKLLCQPLLNKIVLNLENGLSNSPTSRCFLYFTCESYLHTLRNMLLRPGISYSRHVENNIELMELDYLSHVLFRLYEDFSKSQDDPERFFISIGISPGSCGDPFASITGDPANHHIPVETCNYVNGRIPYNKFREMIMDREILSPDKFRPQSPRYCEVCDPFNKTIKGEKKSCYVCEPLIDDSEDENSSDETQKLGENVGRISINSERNVCSE